MCTIEALFRLTDELPGSIVMNAYFIPILHILNYLFNSRLGVGTYIKDNICFQLFPITRIDCSLTSNNSLYFERYGYNIIYERHDNSNIIRAIQNSIPQNWPKDRLATLSLFGDLPLSGLLERLYNLFACEESRRNFLTYFSLVEGRPQVEYEALANGSIEDNSFLLPVELHKFEEMQEELATIKKKLQLRRLRLAMMILLTETPLVLDLETLQRQRKEVLEKTFISMMYVKEERELEATRLALTRNVRIKWEVKSEINLLKIIIKREFILKGVEAIQKEQAIINDLIEKSSNLIEFSIEKLKGTSMTIHERMSIQQTKAMSDILSGIRTFITQVKNRATTSESDVNGSCFIITLRDFNNSLYSWVKNTWRLHIAQEQSLTWNERKTQHELQEKLYTEGIKTEAIKLDFDRFKESLESRVCVEVGERCYDQIFEVYKRVLQCQYWSKRVKSVMKRMRIGLALEINKELKDKEAKLMSLEDQFLEYKKTLMTELKDEIASHDTSFKKEIKKCSPCPSIKNTNKIHLDEESKKKSEARKEAESLLYSLQQKVLKLRVFYTLKLYLKKQKYRGEIDLLREEIAGNTQGHGNLSLAERREFILKQELVHAQESMAGLERVLRKMQTTLKEKNEILMRFNQANHAKAHKMVELEAKVKKYSGIDNIDVLEIQKELEEKTKEVGELGLIEVTNKSQVEEVKKEHKKQTKQLQDKLSNLIEEKTAAIRKVEELQELITKAKLAEINKSENEGGIWHNKCKELLNLCKALKDENESLRGTIKERNKIFIEGNA